MRSQIAGCWLALRIQASIAPVTVLNLRERRKSIGVYCVQRLYQVTTIIIHDPGIYHTRDGIERQDIMMLIGIDVPGRKQKL